MCFINNYENKFIYSNLINIEFFKTSLFFLKELINLFCRSVVELHAIHASDYESRVIFGSNDILRSS